MKKILRKLAELLPHICLILSLMILTFVITDRYNRAMAFVNNDITKVLLMILAVLVIIQSVMMIYNHRKKARSKDE